MKDRKTTGKSATLTGVTRQPSLPVKMAAILIAALIASVACCACSSSSPNGEYLEEATVIYIVDGDTLCVQTDSYQGPQKVRLIGINCPESVASQDYLEKHNLENTQEGVDASEYVKTLIHAGDIVYLQYDQDREDNYGRTLAYVWLEIPNDATDKAEVSSKMLNGILLAQDHAELTTIKPNTAYLETFLAITA